MTFSWRSPHQPYSTPPRQLRLRTLLIAPFVVLTVGAVGLVAFMSYRSGRQAVTELAYQLTEATGDRVSLYLDTKLQTPHRVNQINAGTIRMGTMPGFATGDIPALEAYFLAQLRQFPEVSTIALANKQGGMVGSAQDRESERQFSYRTEGFARGTYSATAMDMQGRVIEVTQISESYDARSRPWYQVPARAGEPTWSPIYEYVSSQTVLGISAGLPVYDETGQFWGVLATDITLDRLNQFLKEMEISPSGHVFIVERSGHLVASSTDQPLFIGAGETLERIITFDADHPIIQDTATELVNQFGDLGQVYTPRQLEFRTPDALQYVHVSPYRDEFGLDWLIVTVVPDTDLMASIYANVRRTVGLSVLALLGAIALGVWLTRRVTGPVLALNQATQAVTTSERLPPPTSPTRIRELETLRQSFQQMATQLNASFHSLRDSEQKFFTLLDNVPIAVSVFDGQGQIRLVNQRSLQIFPQGVLDVEPSQLSEMFQLYRAGSDELYPTNELPVMRALRGETVYVDDIEVVREDGSRMPLEIQTAPVLNKSGQIIYVVAAFQDITARREVERLRANYQQTLEQEVAAKTTALREREAKLKEAQRIAQVGSWEYTLATGISTWSEQLYRIYEADPNTPMDRPDLAIQIIHPNDQERYQQEVIWPASHLQPFESDLRIITQKGNVRWLQVRGEPIYDDQGNVIKLSGTTADVTERKLAEIALAETNRQLQAFLDNAPAAISLFDSEGRYLRVNPAVAQRFNLPESEIIGKTFADLLPEDKAQLFQMRLQILAETRQSLEIEDELELGAERRYFQSILFPVLHEGGKGQAPNTFWAIASDITERKRIETVLQQKTEELDRFFSVALDLLCIADLDGYFRRLNSQWEKTLGYSLEELTGASFITYVHPEDRQATQHVLAGLRERRGVENFVNRYRCRNGSYRWIEWRAVPVGRLVYAAARDITDRKEAEEYWRASEERFSTVFHSNPNPCWIATLDGRCLEVNEGFSRFYGRSTGELIGKTCMDLCLWDNPDDLQAFRQILWATGRLHNFEVVLRTATGQRRTVLMAASVNWINGKDCVIGVFSDISDRKQAELQLQQALAEKEVLLQEIHHRVKNNLQLIQSMLQMQQRRIAHPEADQVLQNSQDRIMAISLAHEILYQSHNLAQIDLAQYLPELIQVIKAYYDVSPRPVTLQVEIEPIVMPLKKAISCGLILNELVTNSLKYAFPPERADRQNTISIHLTVEKQPSDHIIHFSVSDNGIGLPPDFHLSQAKTLGMVLVQAFTEQLYGSLHVNGDQGTKFIISFPMNAP
jgi:PAS domain S-box-containing protein